MNNFTHLHTHTEYSLLDGACRIKELVSHAKSLGQAALAITDHGVMYGCIDFYAECLKQGVKPIIGCEVYVAPDSRHSKKSKKDMSPYHLVLLCKDNQGYKNLVKLVSNAFTEGFYNKPRCDKETLREYSGGLIALSGCLAGEIPRLLSSDDTDNYHEAVRKAREYNEIFGAGNFFIEVQNHSLKEQIEILPLLFRLSAETAIPLCATNDVHYLTKSDAPVQRILTAIATNTTIHEKAIDFETDEFYLKSADEMHELFKAHPEAISNTMKIAELCNVSFEFGVTKLPYFKAEGVTDNIVFFRNQVKAGLIKRYGENYSAEVRERARYEAMQIEKMGFVDYYLIVADFIAYARRNKIPVGPGRGSGVGSLCAYALGITAVDPIRFGLLFERFLNPERISMPDFDIDLCHKRRGEVIDYVVQKYGEEHVAQIITFGTMAARAAIRDAGRAMGLPYAKVDSVAKLVPYAASLAAVNNDKELRNLMQQDPDVADLLNTAMKIEGMPRHGSVHAAGMVITREPVTDFVPVQKADDSASVVTQYAMGNLEQLGLLKMDFLGLRYLTVVHETARAVGIDPENFPESDPQVYQMLSRGKTSGVFQFESEGMTNLLIRLRPEGLEDLTAAISLYRPGPMASIPRYIESRHNPQKVRYKHPLLKNILSVTYGCVVYQEQVMQICRELAGFSYGKADMVRRAMSKRVPELMQKERENFIAGAVANGIDEKTALDIFEELAGFASYAFNKSHAAAYATLAEQTAYLRHYHFKEYMASLLDNTGKLVEYFAECERQGVKILPPDVNKSMLEFSCEDEGIRFGLLAIKNLGAGVINAIIRERGNGEFLSLYDFCKRMVEYKLTKRAVDALIKSGAFDNLKYKHNRRSMIMAHSDIMDLLIQSRSDLIDGQLDLFGDFSGNSDNSEYSENYEMPVADEFPQMMLLQMEKESVGFYISGHPTERYNSHAKIHGFLQISAVVANAAAKLHGFKDGDNVSVIALLLSKKQFVTKAGKAMCFADFEDRTGKIEVVIFSDVYEKEAARLEVGEIFAVHGSISTKEEEDAKILARRIEPLKDLQTTDISTLFINLNSTETGKIAQIIEVLRGFEGEQKVRLCFADTREVKQVKENFGINGVNITKDLLQRLEKLCGKPNIKLK